MKKFAWRALAGAAVLIGASAALAQPANDLCSNAIDLNAVALPYVDAARDLATATNDTVTSIGGVMRCQSSSSTANTVNRGVWYKYLTGASNTQLVLTDTGTADIAVSVYTTTSDCSALNFLFCSDNESNLPVNVPANTLVYICVGTWSTTGTGTGILNFNATALGAAPSNGACSSATPITTLTGSDSVAYNTSLNAPPFSCGGGTWALGGSSEFPIWYSYTTPATQANFAWTEASAEDTVVTVFTGTCGSLTQVTCVDNGTTDTGSLVLNANTTYYFRVSKSLPAATTVNATFGWTITLPPAPPANDLCANATPVSTLPFVSGAVALGGATADAENPSCDSTSNTGAPNGVWFVYTNGASPAAVPIGETTTTDVVVSLWTGSCGTLTQFACDDASVDTSRQIFSLAPNTTYYILVSRFSGTVGSFADNINLSIDAPIAPPANDDCANATVVTPPAAYTSGAIDPRGAQPDADVTCNAAASTNTRFGVWHRVTIPAGDDYTVTIGNTVTANDTVRAVFTGACGSLTQVACFDAESGNTFTMAAGQTYYILTGMLSATTAPTAAGYNVSLSFAAQTNACCVGTTCSTVTRTACATAGGVYRELPAVTCGTTVCQTAPANDLCANATDIATLSGGADTIVNIGALTPDVPASCAGSATAPARFGAWYRFTAGADDVTINVKETGTTNVIVAAYSGACGSLTQVGCDDTNVDVSAGANFSVPSGQTRYFLIAAQSATLTPSASYVLAFTQTPATGACCNGTACSVGVLRSACIGGGGNYLGVNSTCGFGETGSFPIPDYNTTTSTVGTVSRSLTLSGSAPITSISVSVTLTHSFSGDLKLTLTGPGGASADLVARPIVSAALCGTGGAQTGNNGADYSGTYVFSDAGSQSVYAYVTANTTATAIPAGTYLASSCGGTAVSLNSTFASTPITGTWTLSVGDWGGLDTGTITAWSITFNNGTVGPCDAFAGGVCCRGTTCTTGLSSTTCQNVNSNGATIVATFKAASNTCNGAGVLTAPCCFGNFDGSADGVQVADIFAFLSAFFANSPYAVQQSTTGGADPVGTPGVPDIFNFLSAWFGAGGCV